MQIRRSRSHTWVLLALLLGLACAVPSIASFDPARSPASAPGSTDLWNLGFQSATLPITPQPEGALCWESPGQLARITWENDTRTIPVSSGIGFGMGQGDVEPGELVGNHVFAVPIKRALSVDFHVIYPRTESNIDPFPLRFLTLLDEHQLEDAFTDAPGRPFHDLVAEPGSDFIVRIELPPLEPGIHELIVLILGGVDEEPESDGYTPFGDSRFTLLAGGVPQMLPRVFNHLPARGLISAGEASPSLMVGLEEGLRVWNWPETRLPVEPGERVDYNVFTGYEIAVNEAQPELRQPDWVPFAVIAFLNYRQIAVTPGSMVFYGKVSSDTAYSRIAAALEAPMAAGRHDLLVARINYPGVPLCVLRPPPDGLPFPDALSVKRVAIEVSDE